MCVRVCARIVRPCVSRTDSGDRISKCLLIGDQELRKKMTRGNQRELARAKNLKKTVKKAASEQESNKGLSLEQRKARDAERMREKQLKKQGEQADKSKQTAT
ncbi:putative SERF-like protein [Monomorium pharaonis]|uniref:putative SERF-like protein n=1 Tax=Monomorium pharaonis TaxID=307658 RepID=UPI00063F8FBA|nr:putative SERF-like protein [Monomorium pharaonis]